MWLFEQHGFVSVVAYDPKKDYNKSSKFRDFAKRGDTHLLVRARIKEDLDWLKATVPSMLVETDAGADYAYRAVITRKQFKKALAKAVDDLTYGSHFKEVARDNSPKVEGRYSAMMKIWSAFADLQNIKPWSGTSYGSYDYGGYWSGGTKNTSKGSGKSTPVAPAVFSSSPGAKDVEAFLDEYVESAGETTFRLGNGPRTGFKVGDRVQGYSGVGEVIEVKINSDRADTVKVRLDSGNRVTTFISNYLMPEDLPEIDSDADEGHADEGHADEVYDLEWLDEQARKIVLAEGKSLEDFPRDLLPLLDDHAFELLTRLQEAEEVSGILTKEQMNDLYDEVLWEASSDKDRLEIWSDASSVPAKHEQDAIRLFNSVEVSSPK